MCGISGIVNHSRTQPVDGTLLRAMSEVMAHRGPDGHGERIVGGVGLAHRRLSIIDIGGGAQPMANEDGSVWVTFNGEIYNFRELRRQLEAKGHRFTTSSDTEVIVHAYEEWGEDAVARLQGMFAFGLWDQVHRVLLVARDRVGIKPLYYADTAEAFVFASELKAVLKHPAVSRDINPRAIDRFLTYYYSAGSETPFSAIRKLEPGHYLILRDGRLRNACYWNLAQREPWTRDFDEAVEELQDLLRRTVRSHLISDVPVGVLLSGGVDSTGVLRYAAEEGGRQLHTFTVGFDGEGFPDERPFAALASERYGTRHQDLSLASRTFLDFLPRYVWHMEEPVCEPPAVALHYVSKLARDSGVKVLLSGEGGDEAFAGYQTYRNLLALERLKALGGPARAALEAVLRIGGLGVGRLAPYAGLVGRPLSDYYYSRTATPQTLFNRLKPDLYRTEFVRTLEGYESGDVTRELFGRVSDRAVLDRMLYVDSKTWLPDDLLVKADKMTMATSVELRVPLLDHTVLEFAACLPQPFKLRASSGKRILKAALRGSVPAEILNRKKTGFPVPYSRWLRTDGREMLRDTVLAQDAGLSQYFEASIVRGLIERFCDTGEGSKEVFCLLVLELWLQQFTTFPIAQSDPLLPVFAGGA